MANSPRRIYWDACTWIALIQREKITDSNGRITENRDQMCRTVLEAAKKGVYEIVTSSLSLAEVCKHPTVKGLPNQRIADFFDNDYILLASVDKLIGTNARGLMMKGFGSLKPADACHMATAASLNVEALHTFDDRLIKLDQKIDMADGELMKVCKPHASKPSSQATLFDEEGNDAQK